MKILHYALGFPPYRRGGLTKYCMDLMICQIKNGDSVGMLWPGEIKFFGIKPAIKKQSPYVDKVSGIKVESYEIINPLPVPLLEGVKDIEAFTHTVDSSAFEDFLDRFKPDVIHFHTVMGLPYEFVATAKSKGIRLLLTTHDYFGICPKLTLMKSTGLCTDDNDCTDCVICNQNAMSIKKLFILQSPLYRVLKESKLLRKLRKTHCEATELSMLESEYYNDSIDISSIDGTPYQKLRAYYIKIFESMDFIHFNSSVTRDVYSKYMDVSKGVIISVTHTNISDCRKIKSLHSPISITYLGPKTKHKGYFLLREVLDNLYTSGTTNFQLNVYFSDSKGADYLKTHVPYNYSNLEDIMNSTDLLVMPSIWYETFGFTVLEALSYGVPVLVSKNVGAKDLIVDGKNGYIVNDDITALKDKLVTVLKNANILIEMNCNIYNDMKINTIDIHETFLRNLYVDK